MFVVLEVFMEVLIPLLMANIIDIGIANGDMGYITEMGILLVVMAILALVFGAIAGNMAAKGAAGYAKICAMIFFIKFRIFHSRTLISFPRPVW